MDQRQSQIEPHERFRSGAHTDAVRHTNPPLRPHGVTDPEPPPPAEWLGGVASVVVADQVSEDVAAQLDRDMPRPGEPRDATEAEIAAEDRRQDRIDDEREER